MEVYCQNALFVWSFWKRERRWKERIKKRIRLEIEIIQNKMRHLNKRKKRSDEKLTCRSLPFLVSWNPFIIQAIVVSRLHHRSINNLLIILSQPPSPLPNLAGHLVSFSEIFRQGNYEDLSTSSSISKRNRTKGNFRGQQNSTHSLDKQGYRAKLALWVAAIKRINPWKNTPEKKNDLEIPNHRIYTTNGIQKAIPSSNHRESSEWDALPLWLSFNMFPMPRPVHIRLSLARAIIYFVHRCHRLVMKVKYL